MLTKISLTSVKMPRIIKRVNGKDASHRGAFSYGEVIEMTVEVPRELGASAVVLRIAPDGGEDRDIPLCYADTVNGTDIYTISLDTAELCHGDEGLFWYELLFVRGYETVFSDTYNFVDFTLSEHSGGRFLLLVHTADYTTPEWFKGRTMYQIFVDRFFCGEGEVGTRDDVIINGDWYEGVMQYPEKSGDKLANNMFFGGNLWGVAEKLPYLSSLGVGVIYLCPIFKAYSNHKYDTGDYLKIDEMFGGEAAFENLLNKAKEADIRIILDGVFNHTGDDSVYFDRYGKCGGIGAYSEPSSVFRDWYNFRKYPDEYETWWGIEILPKLDHSNEQCRRFFTGKDGVAEKYIKMGIGGWRLDVADELSDAFLDELRVAVKNNSDSEGIIIGEVWENAAVKEAYSRRRRYLRGRQLDSVMNYPFRNAILALLVDKDAEFFADVLRSVYATYPKCSCDCLMNLLGTHDTERILTVLGAEGEDVSHLPNSAFVDRRLSAEQRARGIKMLKVASAVQYTVYGVPSVFYGDEAGIEGYGDPFCRRTFPWGRECAELTEHYKRLGKIRKEQSVLAKGEFKIEYASGSRVVYTREDEKNLLTVIVNASEERFEYKCRGVDLMSDSVYSGAVAPMSVAIVNKR